MRHVTPILFTSCLLGASMPVLADTKFITPGDCQPYGQTSDYTNMPIRADGIRNATTNSNKYLICPLNRDQEDTWNSAGDSLTVLAYFNYAGNGTISCTLTEGQDFSGVVPTAASSANAVVAVGTIRIVQFNDVGIGTNNTAGGTITCRLPPNAKFLVLEQRESGQTDDPPAP